MSPATDHRTRALRSRPGARASALAVLLAAMLFAAGCGDDDSASDSGSDPGDIATTTNADPDNDVSVPDLPVNDDPSAVVCTGPPQGTFDATAIVGEKLSKAERAAQEEGCSIRVAEEDGKGLALTQDFRPDRVNVAVKNGKVTEILNIG